MTITGVSDSEPYISAKIKTSANSAKSQSTGADSISLSSDTINFALSGDSDNVQASNYLSMFSTLNAKILDSSNLSGVGSAIDKYTNSLAGSNVYDSSYTAPSAKYLADLGELKTAAASGNQAKSESLLAIAKFDAPDSVAGGLATAVSKGDTAGQAGLEVEGASNISDFLASHGYSSTGAAKEAAAIEINGLSLYGTDTPTSSAQTRLQQISNLAVYAVENQGTHQSGTVASSASNPLLKIISTLLEAKSGTAIDQSLTSLESLYGVGTSGSIDTNG